MASPKAGDKVIVVFDEEGNVLDAIIDASRQDVRAWLKKEKIEADVIVAELVTFEDFKATFEGDEDEDEDEEDE
jgi:hypothetical protein